MKVRIVEERPGEVKDRAEDVVRVLEKLTGRSLLKAAPAHDDQIKQTAARFEYLAIEQVVKRARKEHVDPVRKLMDEKIAKVLR